MSLDEDTLYGKFQDSAEHYNQMIWTVFSVGIALSLFIFYFICIENSLQNRLPMRAFIISFGYVIFFYCVLTLKNFKKKKEISNQFQNKIYKEERKKDHPLDRSKLKKFREFFFWLSLFLINFAYVYMLFRVFLEFFNIPLYSSLLTILISVIMSLVISFLIKLIGK